MIELSLPLLGPLAWVDVVALAWLALWCKEPRPGTHERFISPLWKQGVDSMQPNFFTTLIIAVT